MKTLTSRFSRGKGKNNPAVSRLSDREFAILELVGQGQSSQTIARQLHLTLNTVEAHRGNIRTIFKLCGAGFFGDHRPAMALGAPL
jgi:DNA-binding CsgD family transcriptional regulator